MTQRNTEEIKSIFSTRIHRRLTILFAWQQGYGGFGVSKSNIAAVVRYIQNQERHHCRMTFEEKFIALLKKHGIEYDPRYVLG